jgi:hypothetical protein
MMSGGGFFNKLLKPEPMSAEDQKKWDDAAKQVNLSAE